MSGLGWHHLTRNDKLSILAGLENGSARGGPYHVELHPTNRCNINCFFCATQKIRQADEIPLSRLDRLIREMKQLGTRSVGLNGGGEPLFHSEAPQLLSMLHEAGLPIANLTTNGVLLTPEIQRLLVRGSCDQVVISVNAADEEHYSRMMGMPRRTYGTVLQNVRALVEARRRGSRKPRIMVHFPVWKENFRTLPGMYARAVSLGVDRIIFSGLSFLKPEQRMTPAETEEMMGLYEDLVRVDEYRRIDCIYSMEQDLSERVGRINARIGVERDRVPRWKRLADLALRSDSTLREKWRHHRRSRRRSQATVRLGSRGDSCLMPWYAMVVKASGAVPVCCVIQTIDLGNLRQRSLAEIWHGDSFHQVRVQMRRIAAEGEHWQHDPETDTHVSQLCSVGHGKGCFMRNFYYWTDGPFVRRLGGRLSGLRASALNPATA
jgi:MoaA/NifB/PqqE/SkfB family radical SAM enzyme